MSSEVEKLIDAQLRVSTAQREQTLQVVREAAADGRLDFDELDQRTVQVMDSRSRADLAATLDDLVPSDEIGTFLGAPAPVGEGPGYSFEQPLVVRNPSWWKRRKVQGEWVVPPFMEVITGAGGVQLDFTRARAAAPVVDMVVMANYGTVRLVVPQGWGVDATALQAAGQSSTVTSQVGTRPEPGQPRIIVRRRSAAAFIVTTPGR